MLLAAVTERNSVADVAAWLNDRTLEIRRRERAREEVAAKRAAEQQGLPPPATQSAPPMLGGGATTKQSAGRGNAPAGSPMPSLAERFDQYKQSGNQAFQARNYDLALQCYLSAAQADHLNTTRSLHTIYSNIAAVYAVRNDWKLSYNYAHQSVSMQPMFAKGHSRMATALMALKYYPEARLAYTTCLNIDPNNKHAADQIAEIDRKMASGGGVARPPVPNVPPAAGNPDGAPTAPAAAQCSAPAAAQTQPPRQPSQLPGATPAAAPAPAPVPTAAQPSMMAHGESSTLPAQASRTAGVAKRTAPLPTEAQAAEKRQHTGTAQGSAQAATLPATAGEPTAQQLQQQGNAAHRLGQHEEALRCFDRAIERYGVANAPAELYSNRSAVLCTTGRYEDALDDADRAVELNPAWSRGHSRRGNALHAMAKKGAATKEDARLAYERALQLDPSNAIVRRALDGLIATMAE